MMDFNPFVEIEADVEIGDGCKIWHFSRILRGSKIGAGCTIGQNVVIGPDVYIGSNCKIQNNVSIYKGVTLEDDVFCGPGMVFTNVRNPRAPFPKMAQAKPTLVCKGASLGGNCTIVCGCVIGKWALVGAGAVVTKSIPAYALVYGNPATIHGYVCVCGEKLNDKFYCDSCGRKYEKNLNGLEISMHGLDNF